ncbi:aminotransferase class IV [Croceivirga sp. JEA036]|uniref:aminotransferase class IV n=1 Tax=Croceivirga sp. JEA036 TaxID=2721162 RepID=UPI00143A2B85|nr:aminotransferase class IV [Croceivirga sp. JEA036]NJB37621.1 hypothetical protein [Croceivirga sp. JEA036]
MFPLFETICIMDGDIQHAEYHEVRFLRSFLKFYGTSPSFSLLQGITIPNTYKKGTVKLKICYNQYNKQYEFSTYAPKKITTLKVVEDNVIDYDLKFTDRSPLTQLWQERGDCDDIIILKNGLLTDTYFANIAFLEGEQWVTPDSCLLQGTCRQRLLDQGILIEQKITLASLQNYSGFQLMNAMLTFSPTFYIPIENIKL